MRTDYLRGLLWAGGGRESQEKRVCGKQRQKKNNFESEKCPVHQIVPETLLSSPFNMPRLGFVSRQCSFTRQSEPISQSTPASILSSTPFTNPVPGLALGLFCNPPQLPKCGRTLTSASSQRVASSLLSY